MTRAPNLLQDSCPVGYYCPAGTSYPIACPAGRYSALTGQDELADCDYTAAGYYSTAAASEATGQCQPGYYCPLGSTGPAQVPCPNRTYLSTYGGASEDDCSLCAAGGYCPLGSVLPIVCPKGYYCVAGVSNPLGCPLGTYGNATGLQSSDECTSCDGGYFCDGYALTLPRGLCDAGYYCISGSNSSRPSYIDFTATNLSSVGALCTTGHYCPEGSIYPTACAAGTFNTYLGSDSVVDCQACPAGFYCEGTGNDYPTAKCDQGYYCTGSAFVSTQFETQPGHFTLTGASQQTECEAGTYTGLTKQTACVDCPEGFYCPDSGMTAYQNYTCPAGYYCAEATSSPTRCPPGSYSPLTGNRNVSQCTPCTSGYYCELDGLTEVTGPCDAGYYCTISSISKVQATVTDTGGPCSKGHYCLSGTGSPTPCPRGTYYSGFRNNGNTCAHSNCTTLYGICPTGSYCEAATTVPTKCEAGYYQDQEGQSECKACPSGSYCLFDTSTPANCTPGSYCPEGTRFATEYLCPNGTYSTSTSLTNVTSCTTCTPGSYCGSPGLGEPTGLCREGYFC
ncbi:hypothetical protein B484DRAFT_327254, partial [Ochromonadaceae sp. CCMP2298]